MDGCLKTPLSPKPGLVEASARVINCKLIQDESLHRKSVQPSPCAEDDGTVSMSELVAGLMSFRGELQKVDVLTTKKLRYYFGTWFDRPVCCKLLPQSIAISITSCQKHQHGRMTELYNTMLYTTLCNRGRW